MPRLSGPGNKLVVWTHTIKLRSTSAATRRGKNSSLPPRCNLRILVKLAARGIKRATERARRVPLCARLILAPLPIRQLGISWLRHSREKINRSIDASGATARFFQPSVRKITHTQKRSRAPVALMSSRNNAPLQDEPASGRSNSRSGCGIMGLHVAIW